MSKKIVVFGAGLVGSAMALDLAKNFEVTSVDIHTDTLQKLEKQGVRILQQDLSQPGSIEKIAKGFDLVVGALPGFMGFRMVKEVIEAGKDMVDISFFPEDPFRLDEAAREQGVTIVTDCGVAPGMGNIILGYHNARMEVLHYECLVGGLPFVREWPYEYKAVFSPIDVIEEYVRPARFIQNGALVTKEALSDPELVHFDQVGTLEAWNSDGLRTLIRTMKIPHMIEKTLRYPGCVEYLRVLRESGFFSYEEVEVNGHLVRPIDVTAKLLFPKWKLKPGEREFTVMKIKLTGKKEQREKTFNYHLFDEYDDATDTLSMARTTGYTCTAVVNLLLSRGFRRPGICPPEFLGEKEEDFQFILNYLKERNVQYQVVTS